MRTRLANALIRAARHLDPNACLDWHQLPTGPSVVVKTNYIGPDVDIKAALEHQRRYQARVAGLTP